MPKEKNWMPPKNILLQKITKTQEKTIALLDKIIIQKESLMVLRNQVPANSVKKKREKVGGNLKNKNPKNQSLTLLVRSEERQKDS